MSSESAPRDKPFDEELLLNLIADALGVPPVVFLNPVSHALGRTSQLLSLWLAIEDPQDQTKALVYLRDLGATTAKPLEVEAKTAG